MEYTLSLLQEIRTKVTHSECGFDMGSNADVRWWSGESIIYYDEEIVLTGSRLGKRIRIKCN